MVYAHDVTRITLSGTMGTGQEQWNTGFFFGAEGSNAEEPTEATATAVLNAWRTFFEHSGSWISQNYVTTQCKVARVFANGLQDPENTFYAYPATTLDGAVATSVRLYPPQCTLVVTLLSDRPRGKASKGRMYLPGAVPEVGSNLKINSTIVGTIADNLKTFFDALAVSADVPGELILAARGTGLTPGLTAQNDFVETIRVGDVMDTQRRRRNGLVESYVSRVLV